LVFDAWRVLLCGPVMYRTLRQGRQA